jgi:ferredoxin
MFAQGWSKHPTIGYDRQLVLKNACQHCGGLCQRVCKYDAIAYFGEKIQITINRTKCTYPKCTICVDRCPQKSIEITPDRVVIHNSCEAEALCWGICPENAIEVPNMAAVQLKKAWWFQESGLPEMQAGQGGPAGAGGSGGQGGQGAPGAMMFGDPTSNPRVRSLVRKEDDEHSFQIMFIQSYPRVPIKKDLWPYHMDDES